MGHYKVLQIAPKLALGGTEKTLQVFSQLINKEIFDVVACGWIEGGVRADQLEREGFKVYVTDNDQAKLVRLMKDEQIQIAHVHRSGFGDDFVVEAAKEAGVPAVVETNVFGRIDDTVWEPFVDYHLFISKMCALRYKNWTRAKWSDFSKRHRVLYYPVNLTEIDRNLPSATQIDRLKTQCGIPLGAPVIGRIGRPDPAKWPSPASLKMQLSELMKTVPDLHIVLMGVPPEVQRELERFSDIYDRVVLRDAASSIKIVMEFYAMIDVLIHTARIGESFGLVIAEAMASAKPVVTKSTPLHDNAQVELIDHGENGYVAYGEKDLAYAAAKLLLNRDLREEMGQRARRKVETFYEATQITRELELIYLMTLKQKGIGVDSALLKRYEQHYDGAHANEIENYEEEYRRRVRTCWGRPNWMTILGYEYLLRHYFVYSMVRKAKQKLISL